VFRRGLLLHEMRMRREGGRGGGGGGGGGVVEKEMTKDSEGSTLQGQIFAVYLIKWT
jgi:hypothetical protein